MENRRIATFFLSTILEQQVKDIAVLPQEFTCKLDRTKVSDEESAEDRDTKGGVQYYSIFRLDYVATVRDSGGKYRRILIEIQKSWDIMDIMRFRKYLGEQYTRVDMIDGKETVLPITTVYILGNNLPEIGCPCVKVGRTHIDMLNRQPIDAKSEFIENLTHDSYVIQTGRITDVRYTTNLDKLLSIFEQKYFVVKGSEVRKEYPYQPEDENMRLITDLLYEMGANPETREEIEKEEEALRIIANIYKDNDKNLKERDKELKEKDKKLKEKDKKLNEKDVKLKEKDVKLKEKDKTIQEKDVKIKEKDKKLNEKDIKIKEKDKIIEKKDKIIAELERLLQNKQIE
jgi:hypothetical protein